MTCYYTPSTQHSFVAQGDRSSSRYFTACCSSHALTLHVLRIHAAPCSHEHLVRSAGRYRVAVFRSRTGVSPDVCDSKALPGVMVRLCAQDCWTALISAAKEGHLEVVRELLENNANPEHRDMVGALFTHILSALNEQFGCSFLSKV